MGITKGRKRGSEERKAEVEMTRDGEGGVRRGRKEGGGGKGRIGESHAF